MKLKKGPKENKANSQVDRVYPDEKNPFEKADKNFTMTNGNHDRSISKKTIFVKQYQKKTSKKEKKEKKMLPKIKNIDRKRERAISNALLYQSNDEKQKIIETKNNTNVQQKKGKICRNDTGLHQNVENQLQNVNFYQKKLKTTSENKFFEKVVQTNSSVKPPNIYGNTHHHTTDKLQKLKRPSEGDIKSLKINRNDKDTAIVKNPLDVDFEEETKPSQQNYEKSSNTEVLVLSHNRALSRRRRTSSIVVSSKKRKKKKRIRIAKRLKRKDKSKTAHLVAHNDDLKLLNSKPEKRSSIEEVANLQENAAEVKNIIADKIMENLDKRRSNLSQLVESTDQLESFAQSFAMIAHEKRMKEETKAKCCGIFSKYRICWYICTCETGVKKKRKNATKQANSQSSVTPRAFADQHDEANEPYEVHKKLLGKENSNIQLRKYRAGNSESTFNSQHRDSKTSRSSDTSLLMEIRNSKLLKSINHVSIKAPEKTERNEISSTDDLESLLARKADVSNDVRLEIQNAISGYGDQDKRKRAAELLLMDHEN